MSIIYALIARIPDMVLSEYTEYIGNFQTISRDIIRNLKKESKITIEYDKYHFHYVKELNLIFFCMTENLSFEYAYAFLTEVKKNLLEKYELKELMSFCSYHLNDFSEVLRDYAIYYNQKPSLSKRGLPVNSLKETKNVEVKKVEKILDPDIKMNLIVTSYSNFDRHQYLNIKHIENRIKLQDKSKKMTILYICIAVIAVVVILLFLLFN